MPAGIYPRSSPIQSLAAAMLQRQEQGLALLSERHYSVAECASALRVHRSTFRHWLKSGLVRFQRTGPKGKLRIPESELQRLLGKGQL